ncbi:uncharacterized protein A1O9_12870, partial [Exophiala aquamarina CBS 119918]
MPASDAGKPNIIVVGAGYAGLTAAIECVRHGMHVTIFESTSKLTLQGDIIQLAANSTRVLAKWGDVLADIRAESSLPKQMQCHNSNGELLIAQDLPPDFDGAPNVYTNRGRTQRIMYEYAASLGIEVKFNHRVVDFFEDEDGAGVVVDDKKFTADAVLVGDGVHSRARRVITGKIESAKTSGFAVYRSWFSLDALKNEPILDGIVNSKEDLFLVWIGPNTHAIVLTNVNLRSLVCFCTHKDEYEVMESWSFPGKVKDMLAAVDGWDERLRAVIRNVPPEAIIDWKLLWRDPAQVWVSKLGRMALIGDSAHPHLPTSGQGAAQAIEDGATIGALLGRSGKEKLPQALQAYQKLRYYRTALTQRMGWELRHFWHKTDWDLVAAQPELLQMPQPQWLFGGDAEKLVGESYDEVMKAVEEGTDFRPDNLPKAYVHEDWTVESMM